MKACRRPFGGYRLFRVVPPSRNQAGIAAAQAMLQNLLGPEPLSLEIAVEAGGRKGYYLRLPDGRNPEGLLPYLRGAYPQVAWEEVRLGISLEEDPAWPRDGEAMAQAKMAQGRDAGLPLRAESEEEGFRAADPLGGLLHLGDGLLPGQRILCQVVARTSGESRGRRYQDMVQLSSDPREREARAISYRALLAFLWPLMGGAVLVGLLFALLRHSYGASAIAMGLALALGGGWWCLRRLIVDVSDLPLDLIAAKVLYPGYDCQVRLTAYDGNGGQPQAALSAAVAAYGQFELGSGNHLMPRPTRFDPRQPTIQCGRPSWLNSLEIATLWHFPQEQAEVSGLERTRAPALLPSGDDSFADPSGCYVGETDHPEASRPVYLPGEALKEHMGVYGASGMGKSNMLRLLGRWIMERGGQLVAIDPHGTLADYLAGAVPPGARERTVYLMAGEASHPFGINMVEVEPESAAHYAEVSIYEDQRAIDRSIDTVLATMERARVEAWGLRMRTIAAYGVKLMAEVGRATGFPYTILDLETLVTDPGFFRHLLGIYRKVGQDPGVIAFWHDAWMKAAESQRREWALPIINRMNLFKSGVMGNIVGSRVTTVDFDAILREGRNLIVNADTGSQENTRVLMGVILDLVNLAVRRRPKADEPRLHIMLDEFQMVSIGNLQGLLNELRKWGVRFILGTQGLGALADPTVARVILNNIQQVFAFACGPQERETVVELLDGAVDEKGVSWLDSFHCYARLRLGGRVQPVFSLRTDPAPPADEAARQELLRASQALYCRDVAQVVEERKAVGQRYTLARFDRSQGTAEHGEAEKAGPAGKPPQAKAVPPLAPAQAARAKAPRRRRKAAGRQEVKKGKATPAAAQGNLPELLGTGPSGGGKP